MAVNKKSQVRINCLLRLMKEKRYPNYPILMKELKKIDDDDLYNVSAKTVQRDIAFLKQQFDAPIKYDTERKGYYLYNEFWDNVPFTEEVEMDAAILGAHFAGTILPPSQINIDIRKGTDALWSRNNGSADETMVLSALVAHGSQAKIDPEIFQTIFEAWQKHNRLQVHYKRSGDGRILDMQLEPHILTFFENIWYLRARLLPNSKTPAANHPFLTLALQRFTDVVNLGGEFELDREEIKRVNDGFLFDLPRLPEVKLNLRDHALTALEFLTPVTEAKQPDGSINIILQGMEEYRILNLVLTSGGNAVILSPTTLKQKALDMAKNYIKQQEGLHISK